MTYYAILELGTEGGKIRVKVPPCSWGGENMSTGKLRQTGQMGVRVTLDGEADSPFKRWLLRVVSKEDPRHAVRYK